MAVKNYTLKEAVEIIAEGKDLETIADLGKRFPIISIKIARLTAKAEKEIIDLMQYMPEYLTIKKVNNAVKRVNDSKAEAEAENKPVEEETAKEVEEPEEKENKTVEPKKRGRKPKAKVKAVPVEEPEAEAEDEADEEPTEAEETANNYEGKKAVDLFKLCKSRGLKVATKKSAKYYIDVLKKDDEAEAKAEAKKAEEAEEDDDWDIEDEPKEVKKPKKSAFIEEDEDDDESWDI